MPPLRGFNLTPIQSKGEFLKMIGREADLWNPLFEKILCERDYFLKSCGSSPDNLFSQVAVKIFFRPDIEKVNGDNLYLLIFLHDRAGSFLYQG